MSSGVLLTAVDTFARAELAAPQPGPGEVMVRALVTGLCGTDLHIADGSHPRARFPLAIGHEVVGVPEDGPLAGRRVLVDPLLPCGACTACDAGASNACARLRLMGIDRDGALAGRFAAMEARLHPIPDAIPDAVATLAEPLAVAVHAVRRLPPLVGAVVVVVGGGPVGCLVAHVAHRSGAEVLVAERAPARRAAAEAIGFTLLDADDPVAEVAARTDGRLADVVVDAAAAASVAAMLGRVVRPRGTVAIVGAYGAPVPIDLQAVMFKELSLSGHRTYLPGDIDAAIGILAADHERLGALVTSVVEPDQVGEAIAAMRRGEGMKAVVRI